MCRLFLTTASLGCLLGAGAAPRAAAKASQQGSPALSVSFDSTSGLYSVNVDGAEWYRSPEPGPELCIAGHRAPTQFKGPLKAAAGTDEFGAWEGSTASFYAASAAKDDAVVLELTFQHYAGTPEIVVGTASFPNGLDTSNCGSNQDLSTSFPAFNTSTSGAGAAGQFQALSWRGGVIADTKSAAGLGALGNNALDCGPVVTTDHSTDTSLVWSTLNAHKIVPQKTADGFYAMGIAAAIPNIPTGYNYSAVFSVSNGGPTAAMYEWGDRIRGYYHTTRLPSVTLTDVGYYTDDGGYYYVWGGANELHDPELSSWIPPRPWAAEEGLILVKDALYDAGVPVAYMQLDDWWYQGKFFFGNVKAVTDWHASNSSGLFPNGLPAFSDKLDLPLQLYTPFFWDNYKTKYNMTESTQFKGTKIVTPNDAAPFFADLFDLGLEMTNGRFNTYEIDFLDSNFQGCAACMEDVGAADRFYSGMAQAAFDRNITIQYCLPSATDMLVSLEYPSVVQARASGDYARPEGHTQPWENVVTLGRASLLLGPLHMAPSKDTLWTTSPQPNTSSDRTHTGYHTQPHVQLDAILATLSMGPVGISDALNYTDVGLISQGFRSSKDSTLLRPSRPLSTVDGVFMNESSGTGSQDIRATHASLSSDDSAIINSHYILAWMSTEAATLQPTDLYPVPPANTALATRQHIVAPATAEAQMAGCVDGQPAHPSCVNILPAGQFPEIGPVGPTIANYSLTAVYEPLPNGAYFVGELQKFVHVSPQRFDKYSLTKTTEAGPCGFSVVVRGTAGETIKLVAVDPKGIVHVKEATIPSSSDTVIVAF